MIRDANAPISQFYEKTIKEGIPMGPEAARQGHAAAQAVRDDPMVQARQSELMAENTEQLLLVRRERDAERARARDAHARVLKASGVTGVSNYLQNVEFGANMEITDLDAAQGLREQINFRHDVLKDPGHIDSFGKRDLRLPGRGASRMELDQARTLEGYAAQLDEAIFRKAHPDMPHVHFEELRHAMPSDTTFFGLQEAAGHQGAKIDQALIDRAKAAPEELIGHSKDIRQLVVQVVAAEEAAYKRADRTHSEQDRADARGLSHDRQAIQEMLTALKAIETELNIGRREAAAQGRQQDARFQGSKRHGRE